MGDNLKSLAKSRLLVSLCRLLVSMHMNDIAR